MQQLIFADAWNKTISPQDRYSIEEAFSQVALIESEDLQFTTLWQAVNYRGDLLVTALIHNCTEKDVMFHDQPVCVTDGDKILVTHRFTLPLQLKGKTSMPWTFIFPNEHLPTDLSFDEHVQLTFDHT